MRPYQRIGKKYRRKKYQNRTNLWLLFSLLLGGVLHIPAFTAARAEENAVAVSCAVPSQFTTIQAAINNVACTDINVAVGVYRENLLITRTLNILGADSDTTIVDGNGLNSVFNVRSPAVVRLSRLTIRNGFAANGGGVLNAGNLTLTDVFVVSNRATNGAGIYNEPTGRLQTNNVIVNSNNANTSGGGIHFTQQSQGNLARTAVTSNSAFRGGGINNSGVLTLADSAIAGNVAEVGGGLRNTNIASVSGSTLNDNIADQQLRGGDDPESGSGAGIFNSTGAQLSLLNNTLSANEADRRGGGLANSETVSTSTRVTITFSTINENRAAEGGAIYNSGVVNVGKSILANSQNIIPFTGSIPNCANAIGATISSQGYNISNDTACPLPATGDRTLTDPRLDHLSDNGGSTLTYALLASSPALNAIPTTICPPPSVDQRGVRRPQGSKCDIGSVENDGISDAIYLSSTSAGSVGGVNFGDEDILLVSLSTQTWRKYFDGSDVGLGLNDIKDFLFDGSDILLTPVSPITLTGIVGLVGPNDVVRFTPLTLGERTTGSFSRFLNGSDVGLTTPGEQIDGVALTGDGRLLISTAGSFNVPGPIGSLAGDDSQLIVLNNATFGDVSSGTWDLYFDGNDVDLTDSSEDIRGIDVFGPSGDIYMNTLGNFTADPITGTASDVFVCHPLSLGANTNCTYTLFFQGALFGFSSESIDGIEVGEGSTIVNASDIDTTPIDPSTAEEDAYDLIEEDRTEESIDTVQQLFLPLAKY